MSSLNKNQEEASSPPAAPPSSSSSVSSSDSHLCCCVCYCAVDFSEREAFENGDTSEGDNQQEHSLLPCELFDDTNALLLCDSCDRPFHQRCHFVPVVALPRGDWHCLVCKTNTTTNTGVYPFPPKNESGNVLFNTQHQLDWEFSSKQQKVSLWKREVVRLERAIRQQLQQIRLSQDTLRAHTSTRRAQQHFSLQRSQQLKQCVLKLATAKLRVRNWMLSFNRHLKHDERDIHQVQQYCNKHADQRDKYFPYGMDLLEHRRKIPTCGNDQDENGTHDNVVPSVPTQVSVPNNNDDDDDDMISLDDLQCCICFRSDASDENDLVLCDGEGCFRAYHMHCVSPELTLEQVEAMEDWFCPICTCVSNLVAEIQSEYTGDEWGTGDEESTVYSWNGVEDVFREAPLEYKFAMQWKEGKHSDELISFLSNLLGMSVQEEERSNASNDVDSEDDDSEDDDFDLETFQQTARDKKEDDDASSCATLQDMSSVELNIGKGELDALSVSSYDSSHDESGRRRTRSSRAASPESSSGSSSSRKDVGALDESNIVEGKRRRTQVDYRRLNDSMFGDISDGEVAKLDGGDEFRVQKRSSSSSSDSDDSSEDETNDSSSEEEEESASEDANSKVQPKSSRLAKKQASKRKKRAGSDSDSSSEANEDDEKSSPKAKRRPKRKKRKVDNDSESDEHAGKPKSTRRGKRTVSKGKKCNRSEEASSDEDKKPKARSKKRTAKKTAANDNEPDSEPEASAKPERPSGRGKRQLSKTETKSSKKESKAALGSSRSSSKKQSAKKTAVGGSSEQVASRRSKRKTSSKTNRSNGNDSDASIEQGAKARGKRTPKKSSPRNGNKKLVNGIVETRTNGKMKRGRTRSKAS